MTIQITARHLEITGALKHYVTEKLNKLNHHFDNILSTKVVLEVKKDLQCVEAVVSVPGNEFIAKAEDYNMYAAIDSLEDKLDAQIRKHKQKLKNHRVERPDAEVLLDDEIPPENESHP